MADRSIDQTFTAALDALVGEIIGKASMSVRKACLALVSLCSVGCQSADTRRVEPTYDTETGRLELLKVDTDGDGTIDAWSHMDGARFIRIEIDTNQDGIVDRWEYYGTDQKLEKIGSSRANDGKPDRWAYHGPDGKVARVEISTRNDGRLSRIEHYEAGVLARAEEDGGADGKMDKWETYANGAVTSVAFDTTHRGFPDRRLVYGPGGSGSVEVDSAGTGKFVPLQGNPLASSFSRKTGH